jgi:hypothetical protein
MRKREACRLSNTAVPHASDVGLHAVDPTGWNLWRRTRDRSTADGRSTQGTTVEEAEVRLDTKGRKRRYQLAAVAHANDLPSPPGTSAEFAKRQRALRNSPGPTTSVFAT